MAYERELSRVNHYCSLLGLNSMDRKDMVKLFEVELSIGSKTGTYVQQRRKIQRLDLDNIYHEIAVRLNSEDSEFEYNQNETNLSDDEIWAVVYQKNDDIFKKLIDKAKQTEREVRAQKGGCMLILPVIIISLSTILLIFILVVKI